MIWVDMLQEFHKKQCFQPPDSPQNMPNDIKILRLRLMMEELGELTSAIHEDRLIDVADGLVDLLYVTVGTAVECGMGNILNEMFCEVHRSNMSKDFLKNVGGRKGGIKGLNYTPPDLGTIIIREQMKK